LSGLAANGREQILITKGAPESVLSRCVAIEIDGLAHALDESWQRELAALQDHHARDGFRLLAVATRNIPTSQKTVAVGDQVDTTDRWGPTVANKLRMTSVARTAFLRSQTMQLRELILNSIPANRATV